MKNSNVILELQVYYNIFSKNRSNHCEKHFDQQP